MRKPSCSADSVPSALAMPSIVVISRPSACTANMVQLFTDMPSMSTVQAPQCVVSQPIWVPVSCRFSRMKWTSSVRGSTRPSTSAPLTVICHMGLRHLVSLPQPARPAARFKRARDHDAADMLAVFDRAARIGGRRHDRLRRRRRFLQRRRRRGWCRSRRWPRPRRAAASRTRLVRPMAQVATLPPLIVSTTAAAAVA